MLRNKLLFLALLFFGLFSFCASSQSPAHAQDDLVLPALTIPKTTVFWADGITQVNELDAYKKVGFNTVVIRVPWQPSANGEVGADDLNTVKNFAQEAGKRNLRVVYALPAAPDGFVRAMRIAVDSQAYNTLWTTWVAGTVNALEKTPNLQGWMLPDDPRSLPLFDDYGFQQWVLKNYASIGILNRQWGANYQQLDDISINDVVAISAKFRAPLTIGTDLSYDEVTRLSKEGVQSNNAKFAFHPATLALAAYKLETYRSLLTMWVGAVRGADEGKHLVFSGKLPDYAQVMAQPSGIDVIMPSIVPGVAENDIVTHNPQGIDMARRGGKFSALPVFSAGESALLPKAALPDLVGRWMGTACARGAMGIGFDSWQDLKDNLALITAVTDKLKTLTSGPYASLWNENPVSTTAIIITPLADGATVSFGNRGHEQLRGLYGFGEDLVLGEPSNLVWALRWGSSFGSVDYLAPDDLDTSLDHYTTIFAPQLLDCPLDISTQLGSYVFRGGTLVADLGIGAMQNGGQVSGIPPQIAQLFGVPAAYDINQTTFNISGEQENDLLPSWSRKIGIRRGVQLTGGDGPASSAFAGTVGFSSIPPSANVIAAGPLFASNQGVPLRAPLTVQRSGRGYAVFAPFRLWQFWRPGYNGYNEFHGDLMARGAALAMRTADVVPQPMNQAEGQTRFPEVINRAKQIVIVNHDAPGQMIKPASIETTGAGDWLWNGAITQFLNTSNSVLSSGRPAPINGATYFESRPRPILLFSKVPPGESAVIEMVPITVQNLQGGPIVSEVATIQPGNLEINVWPNSADVVTAETNWQPMPGVASPFRVSIYSSDSYKIKPNTRYRAVATDYNKQVKKNTFQTTEKIAVADSNGKVTFEFSGAAVRVKIVPIL